MNWRRDPRLAYALVNLCTLFWATNFALGRLLRDDIGPFTLTAARFTVAAVVFTALLLRRPAGERRPGREWPLLLGMGVTGVFGFGSLLYTGLRTTTATNASLINGTGPLVIGILAALTLHERFGRRQAIGAVISLAGVALVVSGGSLAALTHLRLNTGDLLVLAAVLAWGVYSVLSRIVTRTRSALTATAVSTWFGLPLLWSPRRWNGGRDRRRSASRCCWPPSTSVSSLRSWPTWPGTKGCAGWGRAKRRRFTTCCRSTARCWASSS